MLPSKKKMKIIQNSSQISAKINPFDLKINRKKHNIIGQKKFQSRVISKSKTEIYQKHKEFFKKNYLHKNKANSFVDKRIGEYDFNMLKEDRIMARLAVSQRQHKKSLYNLNDEFDLTHNGKSISTSKIFDDIEKDSDEDEVQLNAKFINDAHFGGFLMKKVNDNTPKTRKEILDEFIVESKKQKQEKQKAKELTDDMTSKLDEEWKHIHSILPNGKFDQILKASTNPFDMIVKELKFEPRGTAVLITKSEEIENEKKRIKLDQERLSRMNSLNKKNKCESYSADALDEHFMLFNTSEVKKNNSVQSNDIQDDEDNIVKNCDDLFMKDLEESDDNAYYKNWQVKEERSSFCKSETFFPVPQTYENLIDLISNLTLEELSLKINSIVSKCQHKVDTEAFKISLNLFEYLLIYIDFMFEDEEVNENLLDVIAPCLLILAQKSPLETCKIVRNFLLKKIFYFQNTKHEKKFEFFSTLIILKLCGYMYSVSDFHHPVLTLSVTLMSDMLTSCFHVEHTFIVYRLFVCHIISEYISHSKRYVPEAVNYLFSILTLASKSENLVSNVINKLKLHSTPSKKILYVFSSSANWKPIEFSQLIFKYRNKNVTSIDLLSIIYYTIEILGKFAHFYRDIPIFLELFHSSINLSSLLPVENYPVKLVEKINEIQFLISPEIICKQPLTFLNKKSKSLKLFTPKFEDYHDKKPTGTLQKLKVRKELSKKIKKEERGIIREIRRDVEFEAKEQLRQRTAADSQRKRKLKELYAHLAKQEGDFKKMSNHKK